jgi:hypothetical protein
MCTEMHILHRYAVNDFHLRKQFPAFLYMHLITCAVQVHIVSRIPRIHPQHTPSRAQIQTRGRDLAGSVIVMGV